MTDYTPRHLIDKILQSKSALEGERKQVTVLFADIQGSMELASRLDPEHWHQLLERYFRILTDAVHRFEGTINQYTGDGIMALFGAPIAHEDHAQRAGYAALQARDLLVEFAGELRQTEGLGFGFRIGLNTGDVVVGRIGDDLRMDYTAQGATVGIAQRIEQVAEGGQICLSSATARIVDGFFELRSLGQFSLKGIAGPVAVHLLERASYARTRFDVAITRGLSRFVGRAQEMENLEAALARAQAGHGQVVGIVGEPGLGKSRLCLEFVARCRAAGLSVYEVRCPAHGRNIPYLPILELFRNFFALDPQDDAATTRRKIGDSLLALDAMLSESLPVLYEFMGVGISDALTLTLDAEVKQRQLYDLLHRIVRAQDALGRVSVTLIDDLHWVDAGSDAFVNQLVNAIAGRRGLVVLNFRPEYVAAFASRPHYQQLPLVPLGEAPGRELVTSLIGTDPSVGELAERIVDWTTGNPFYTEELVNSLIETGVLAGVTGAYRLTTALSRLTVPDNIRAVLAARIDRLPDAAKRLLQTAAVIGREFSAPILEAVIDLPPADVATALERLRSGDFIFERALYPVFEYAFKHPLTHEVAYQSLLQSRRAAVHSAVAVALEEKAGDKLDESAALLAHHCEAAGQLRDAARWHRRAAEWTGMNDLKTALLHWQRAQGLVRRVPDTPESTELQVEACSRALVLGWRLGESASEWSTLFEQGCAAAEQLNDQEALSRLKLNYSAIRGLNQASAVDYERYAADAVIAADRAGARDLRCAARAYLAYGHWYRGNLAAAVRVAEEIRNLAGDDADLGAKISGLSPLVASYQIQAYFQGVCADPARGIHEARRVRDFAIERGYRDMAGWLVIVESEVMFASGITDGLGAVAQNAQTLAQNRGAGMEVMAACAICNSLSATADWRNLLAAAEDALKRIRETGTLRLWEPNFLAHLATAQYHLDEIERSCLTAQEAVEFIRESGCRFNPQSYELLARAQLGSGHALADVTRTLDEYEAILDETGYTVYLGKMHELRAQIARREGRHDACRDALQRARASYSVLGLAHRLAHIDAIGTP